MSKIMIVDDDRSTVSLLTILLQMDGYHVVSATPRASVLDEIRQERPDLVLLDVFLSDIEGTEVLKRIREDPVLEETRVVMISGMELSEECRAAGADAFLLKPYTPDQLATTIRMNLPPASVEGG